MCSNASSSLSTSLSTAPLSCAWMCEPPSSSLGTSRPKARYTTGGPATKSWLEPRTMTEKCDAATRAAPSPATGPSAAATTGTCESRTNRDVPVGVGGDIGAAERGVGAHAAAAAGAVDEADDREAELARGLLAPAHLVADGAVGGAAADGEVIAADDDRPAIDGPPAGDKVGWCEGLDLAVLVVLDSACERADFSKGSGIEELVDALADGCAALGDVARDALFAAHLFRALAAASESPRAPAPRSWPSDYSSRQESGIGLGASGGFPLIPVFGLKEAGRRRHRKRR